MYNLYIVLFGNSEQSVFLKFPHSTLFESETLLTLNWPESKIFETSKYRTARFEAHNALFWMARCAHSFLTARGDHKHMDLLWQSDSKSFRTKIFDGDLQIGLHLPDLELYFCEHGIKVPHSFWFDDRTPAYVEAWYLIELVHRDRDRSKFSTDLPFESVNMLMGDTKDHNASAVAVELDALQKCFEKAADLFVQVSQSLLKSGHIAESTNLITLNPESFSLVLDFKSAKIKKNVTSIGLSAGDDLRPAPFFFTAAESINSKKKTHALDFDAETLITLNSLCAENVSEESLIKRLCENIEASINKR